MCSQTKSSISVQDVFRESNSKKFITFLDFTKEDIVKATGLSKSSIRFDENAPKQLMHWFQDISNVVNQVVDYFSGDVRKATLWFQIKNPAMGNFSPRDMIRYGRYQKLVKFVQNTVAGNMP